MRHQGGLRARFRRRQLRSRRGRRPAHPCRHRARIRDHAPAVLSRQLRPPACQRGELQLGRGRLENTYFYKASLGYELTRYWMLVPGLRLRAARRQHRGQRVRSPNHPDRGSSRGSDAANRRGHVMKWVYVMIASVAPPSGDHDRCQRAERPFRGRAQGQRQRDHPVLDRCPDWRRKQDRHAARRRKPASSSSA